MADPDPPIDADAKLRATLAALPEQRFAAVDGGQFKDLPALLKRRRLFGRSLFLEHADVEVEKAGPWLVGLDQAPDAVEALLSLVGDLPAAVFWSCADGEAVLHRHLRTLNMARIPAWAALGEQRPPADGRGQDLRPVMFRHWDPRVLGALMPALDASRFARVLGPAREIAFLSHDYGGVRRVVRDEAWPAAPPGPLSLTSEQVLALSARRVEASHRRILEYLRAVWPEEVERRPDGDLMPQIRDSHRTGTEIGLTAERAQSRLAYLMVMSGGRIIHAPGVRPYHTAPGTDPDQQMEEFMAGLVVARQRLGDP